MCPVSWPKRLPFPCVPVLSFPSKLQATNWAVRQSSQAFKCSLPPWLVRSTRWLAMDPEGEGYPHIPLAQKFCKPLRTRTRQFTHHQNVLLTVTCDGNVSLAQTASTDERQLSSLPLAYPSRPSNRLNIRALQLFGNERNQTDSSRKAPVSVSLCLYCLSCRVLLPYFLLL